MWIDTARFGRLRVPDKSILRFPLELYGLSHSDEMVLLDPQGMAPFRWLQSLGSPTVSVVVVEPFLLFPDYEVEVPTPMVDLLQAKEAQDLAVYATVTIAPKQNEVYANLLGPLIINHAAQVGAQVIQDGHRYQVRHAFALRPLEARRPQHEGIRPAQRPGSGRLALQLAPAC
jgi:flagellar assembly factor FliW